jgi:hypothetical protein
MADAQDLKSWGIKKPCGFESHHRHQSVGGGGGEPYTEGNEGKEGRSENKNGEVLGFEVVDFGLPRSQRLVTSAATPRWDRFGLALWVALFLFPMVLWPATVRTLDGQSYDGDVFLDPGNVVSVVLKDSSKRSIPLDKVESATFTSELTTMMSFGQISEGWTNSDVGDVTIAGIAGQSNRLFAVRVGSDGIGDKADSFHFVHFRANGNVDVTARVVAIAGADRMAKVGVMIRDTLRPDAKFALIGVTASGQVAFEQRHSTGAKAVAAPVTAQMALPCWLRISRRDKTVTVYRSVDGKQWEQLGNDPAGVKESYYAGLAVSSHSALSFCTASIDNVSRTISGVRGEYFADSDFSKLATNRVDTMVNFQWIKEPPAPGLKPYNFSVRWTGEVEPRYSEPYIFYFDAEDARLWIDGQEIPHIPLRRERRDLPPKPLLLKAGNRYPLRFDYRHVPERNPVRLGWSSQSQSRDMLGLGHVFCTIEAEALSGRSLKTTNQSIMGKGILLRNGTFLAGPVRAITADGAKVAYRSDKEFHVPLHQVARAIFRVSPRNAILANPTLPAGALLGNGDFVEGELQFGRGRDFRVSSVLLGLRKYNLDQNDVAALVVGSPSRMPFKYELHLSDNSIVKAQSISVEQEHVTIVEPLLGSLQVPRSAVTELRSAPTDKR